MWGEGVREIFVKNEELKLALEVDLKYIAFINNIKCIYLWWSLIFAVNLIVLKKKVLKLKKKQKSMKIKKKFYVVKYHCVVLLTIGGVP